MGKAMELANTGDKATAIEAALIGGDLARLTAEERVNYYRQVCRSLDLNELTKPFEYITLNGKLTLYARRDCTDQLRSLRNISITIVGRERHEDVFVVTAKASFPNGRQDESVGAVSLAGLKGEALANAYMKAETKAKRRVTLSACGLGLLDEMEVDMIHDRQPPPTVRTVRDAPALEPAPQRDEPRENDAPEKPNGTAKPAASAKAAFFESVRQWSGMSGKDLADACHAAARKLGHAGAAGLTDEQYAECAEFCDEAREAGTDFIAATATPEPKTGANVKVRPGPMKGGASTVDINVT